MLCLSLPSNVVCPADAENSNEPNVVPLSKSKSPDIEVITPCASVPPLSLLSNTTKSPSLYPLPLLLGSTITFSTLPSSILPIKVFARSPTPSSDCGKLTCTFSDLWYNEPTDASSDFIEPPMTAVVLVVLTVSKTSIGVLPWTSFKLLSVCVPSSSRIKLPVSSFSIWNASVLSDSDETNPVSFSIASKTLPSVLSRSDIIPLTVARWNLSLVSLDCNSTVSPTPSVPM